jgi:transposase InsO family protein
MGQKRYTPEQIIGKLRQLVEQWRREYNTIRPHSSLGYRLPAPKALRPDRWWLRRPELQGPGLAAGPT